MICVNLTLMIIALYLLFNCSLLMADLEPQQPCNIIGRNSVRYVRNSQTLDKSTVHIYDLSNG